MRDEDEFSLFVLNQLKNHLKDKSLSIASGKNILTDVTCIFENNKFELIHGFSEVDIVIYKEQKFDFRKENNLIKFYGDKDIKDGNFAIPFIILELKTGRFTTDGIRSRDFVAGRIREMFPFVAYYFIGESTTKEEKTLLRQGKSFTNYFISKEQIDERYLTDIYKNYISPHIVNLKRQLKIIDQ